MPWNPADRPCRGDAFGGRAEAGESRYALVRPHRCVIAGCSMPHDLIGTRCKNNPCNSKASSFFPGFGFGDSFLV